MYIRVVNNTPSVFTAKMLRDAYPNTSFPRNPPDEVLAQYSVFPVTFMPDPPYDEATERLVSGTPVEVNGVWQQTAVVQPLSPEEVAAKAEDVANEEDKEALKSDGQVAALLKARPGQINAYVDNNVSNMAEAKEVMKILARAVSVLAQRVI
jgi:hypothetical protein